MHTKSEFEEAARARKVVALISVFPAARTQGENDLTALFIEDLKPIQRRYFEIMAGVKESSDTTWAMVAAAVRARHFQGDGGAIDVRRDVRRPDFGAAVAVNHRAHYYRDSDQRCVPCEVMTDSLNRAFDQGVTAAIRAVGL